MICNFHLTLLSFNIKSEALLLWTVNPAYFDLIGQLNYLDIDKRC